MRRDALWVLGTFLLLGLLGAVLWSQLAQPPYFVRTADNALMDQRELGRQIRVDGLYVVIGVAGGAIGGLGLAALRRRDPLLVVLLGAAASVGAGYLALRLGEQLGQRDVVALVRAAKPGAKVVDTLRVISDWVVVSWPFGFAVGALSVLLTSPEDLGEDSPGDRRDDGSQDGDQVGGRESQVDTATPG